MNIIVSQEHIENFAEMEEYAIAKAGKLTKYHPKVEKISVRLISEKSHRNQEHDYYCEIAVDIPGRNLEIVDVERSVDKAIDRAVERMKRLMVRDKEKKITRKHRGALKEKYSEA